MPKNLIDLIFHPEKPSKGKQMRDLFKHNSFIKVYDKEKPFEEELCEEESLKKHSLILKQIYKQGFDKEITIKIEDYELYFLTINYYRLEYTEDSSNDIQFARITEGLTQEVESFVEENEGNFPSTNLLRVDNDIAPLTFIYREEGKEDGGNLPIKYYNVGIALEY